MFLGKTIKWAIALMIFISLESLCLAQQTNHYVNAQLPWHQAALDSQGRLLAWYEPEKNLGYDHVVRLAWNFIEHTVPIDPKAGVKVYLINAVFDPHTLLGINWQHDPAMLYATFVDSLAGWYPYSGDEDAVKTVQAMLDYQLAHGTTPSDWDWPNVPFSTSCNNSANYGRCLQDMPQEFYGGLGTDKVGELGTGYALFYEMTGDKKYLEAALNCANALAKHVRPGDATHTPWPFRVDARTGAVIDGEEYGGMTVGPVRLFDELIRLKAGDTASFQKARDVAWSWILKYPMHTMHWSGYFEDVPKNMDNVNQTVPTMTAYYILKHQDPASVDSHWMRDVGRIIDWTREHFGRGPYFGAWGVDEQGEPPDYYGCCSRAGLGSDSSRWGAINAMYYEKTGDAQSRENAFRSLNYATYFAASDGKISCCGQGFGGQYWFSDGYGDYIRHFMWAMAAIPAFAPKGQNHLLGSSSVVQKVSYGDRSVTYRTFDREAREVLRLHFKPVQVTAGGATLHERQDLKSEGYTIQPLGGGDYAVRVHHVNSNEISIKG